MSSMNSNAGYSNFFGGGGFGSGFGQYYDLYAQAPVGQGMPSISKGLQAGTLTDMGGGMYSVNKTRGSNAFTQGPSYLYSGDQLNNRFGQNRGRMQFGAALMGDYNNMISAGQQHSQNVNRALGNMEAAYGQGAQNIRQSGIDAYNDLTGRADQYLGIGQDFLNQQTEYGKDVLATSDKMMQDAINNYEKTTGADASSMMFGAAKQRGSQRNALAAEAKMGNPQAQAALDQMDFETMQQTQQTMTQVASAFNQTKANMEMARAQNYGQVGTAVGGMINQAGGVMASFAEMSKGLYEQGVAMKQGAEAMANQFYAQGQTALADRIIANPGSPISMASVLAAMFQFDMTPGTGSLTGMPGMYLGPEYA